MTRHTIYRIALATLMLPVSFTAYWWLLPRRMKRIRTALDAILWKFHQKEVEWMVAQHEKFVKFAEFLRSGQIAPIGQREFRVPFCIMKSDGWHIE